MSQKLANLSDIPLNFSFAKKFRLVYISVSEQLRVIVHGAAIWFWNVNSQWTLMTSRVYISIHVNMHITLCMCACACRLCAWLYSVYSWLRMRVKVVGDDHLWTCRHCIHVELEYCINVILFAIFDLDWNLAVNYLAYTRLHVNASSVSDAGVDLLSSGL